jgi:hypothetical protein
LEASNLHFSDSGVFVLRGNVSGDNVNRGLESISRVFKSLDKIKPEVFEGAKKNLGL